MYSHLMRWLLDQFMRLVSWWIDKSMNWLVDESMSRWDEESMRWWVDKSTSWCYILFLPSIVDHDLRLLFTNQRLERGPLTHSHSLPSPHCFECLCVCVCVIARECVCLWVFVRAGIFFNVIYAWQCVTLEVDFAWVNGSWEFLKTYFFNLRSQLRFWLLLLWRQRLS